MGKSATYHGGGAYKPTWPGAGGPGTDELVKITAADTTPDYLNPKIAAGAGMAKAVLNPGANEQLQLSCTVVNTDKLVEVTAADTTPGNLNAKIAAGAGIALAVLNPGGNEQLQISAAAAATRYGYVVLNTDDWRSWSGGGGSDTNWNTAQIKSKWLSQNTGDVWSILIPSPLEWNAATPVYIRLWWTMDVGSSADTHTFEGGLSARSNDELADTAFNFNTNFSFFARAGSDDYVYVAGFNCTPQFTPTAGDLLLWKHKRTDTESGDPKLLKGIARFTLT